MEVFDVGSLSFLQASDKQAVLRYIKEIRESNRPLFIGQRFHELQTMLAPYGYFLQALAATGIVMRTAYGYMYGYRNVTKELPAGAVQAMMDRKLVVNANRGKMFGEWTEAIAAVPPPLTGSAAAYDRWVEAMMQAKPKRVTGHRANRIKKDPDELLRECVHVVERAYKRLPPHSVSRERFARKLIGEVMKQFGLDTPQKFSPGIERVA